jgi:hypothetical protein
LLRWRDRYTELSDRDLNARTAALLRERGEFDPANLGHQLVAASEPLSAAEHLEHLAIGEMLARYYRHPSMLDHAVKAGASWEQIGAARGTSAGQACRDYREWAEGQHNLLTWTEGRTGKTDAEYAKAIARASDPETCPAGSATPPASAFRPAAGSCAPTPTRTGRGCTGSYPARRARPRPNGTPRRRPGSKQGRTRGA